MRLRNLFSAILSALAAPFRRNRSEPEFTGAVDIDVWGADEYASGPVAGSYVGPSGTRSDRI